MSSTEGFLHDLLVRTSRTFALAIPLLPPPTRREVNVAYLLFRVADTIEDSPFLSKPEKCFVLRKYRDLLRATATSSAGSGPLGWTGLVAQDSHCQELLQELPFVMEAARSLRPGAWQAVAGSLEKSLAGMERFVAAGNDDGSIRLRSVNDLRDYCYCVAGLVGEMLTQIFVLDANPPVEICDSLMAKAKWFGEGLQLINVIKDADADAAEGRRFIPEQVSIAQVVQLAREDLRLAEQYIGLLRQADVPGGWVAFTELPLALAWRTLECVTEHGPGSKVPRAEVMALLSTAMSRIAGTADTGA